MATNEDLLNAPIPGMSLTAEPKSRPWRRPYQVSNVEEAVALYAPMFRDKTTIKMMVQQIEKGIPLTTIADLLISGNVMEGRHSLDVGMLIAPVLIETMITVADMAGVDYRVGGEDREDPQTKQEIINRALDKIGAKDVQPEEEVALEDQPVAEEQPAEEPTGLMARRSGM